MRVLLAVACLVAVFSQDQAFEMSPGAKSGTFLNEVQTEMIELYSNLYPNGQKLSTELQIFILTAEVDLCKINDEQRQREKSIFMGETCKIEFVKLYNDDPEQCSAVFCDVTTGIERSVNNTARALIAAETDDEFFGIIREQIVDPMMEYSCKCLMKMLGAWMNCKRNIGEADIWDLVLNLGGFDTSAEYLRGQPWKDFWVNVLVERIPWDNIKIIFGRTVTYLCQRNTDKMDGSNCYTYLHDAFTKLYEVFLKATGKTPAVKENATLEDDDTPSHCTTFSRIFFGSIKKTIVAKFCVEDCVPFYQRALFGCCTASINQDTELKRAAKKTTKRLTEIVDDLLIGVELEEVFEFDIISIIFREFEGVLKLLRNPACDESYDMTPCTEECQETLFAGQEGRLLEECNDEEKRGWVKVTRGTYIDFDPKNVPLEINTTSLLGSNEKMILTFYTARNDYAGGLGIKFSRRPKYRLSHCSPWKTLKKIPDGQNRTWRIAIQDMGPSFRLVILCNTVQVLDVTLSYSTCSDSNWRSYWNDDVKKIYFNRADRASVAYKPYTGWIQVQGSGYINQNMDNSPFKIKTLSDVGSNERVVLNFYTNEQVSAGGLRIVFSDPPQYQLHECTNLKNFLRDLPASDQKIWNIEVKKNQGIKVLIYCNEELMVETELSDETCNYNGSWSEKWTGYMRKVRFTSEDTASKFYKPSKEN